MQSSKTAWQECAQTSNKERCDPRLNEPHAVHELTLPTPHARQCAEKLSCSKGEHSHPRVSRGQIACAAMTEGGVCPFGGPANCIYKHTTP